MTMATLANMPRVNLLPPEIRENQRLRRVQLVLALGVVLTLAGVGLLYVNGQSGVSSAKNALANQQQKQTALQAKLNSLQYVTQIKAAGDSAEAALTQATATEVHWSEYLSDLSLTVPHDVWLTSVSFTEAVPAGSLLTAAQAPATVGSMQIAATTLTTNAPGASHNGVADWLDAAVKEKGFADVWFTGSQEAFIGPKRVATFTSSLNLTSDALTKRCTQPGVC
jgi:Tfp pilus assembly protein PilN